MTEGFCTLIFISGFMITFFHKKNAYPNFITLTSNVLTIKIYRQNVARKRFTNALHFYLKEQTLQIFYSFLNNLNKKLDKVSEKLGTNPILAQNLLFVLLSLIR